MSHNLICIRTFQTVYEADFQRALLTEAGIPCCTDNCFMVLWFWQYSQAVGGVKVYIDSTRLENAARVLVGDMSSGCESSEPEQPEWPCPQCGAEVPAGWESCWQCAPELPANRDSAVASEAQGDLSRGDSPHFLLASAASVWLAWSVISFGMQFTIYLGVVFAANILFSLLISGPGPVSGNANSADAEAEAAARVTPLLRWPSHAAKFNAVAQRAWRAAVVGLLWFPPLLLYSLCVLFRLGWRWSNLSRIGRAWVGGSVAILVAAATKWGMLLWLILR
jgi:hypothetical protein